MKGCTVGWVGNVSQSIAVHLSRLGSYAYGFLEEFLL